MTRASARWPNWTKWRANAFGIVTDLSHSLSTVRVSIQPTLVEALNAVTSQLRRRLRTAFPAASDSDIAWCLTELQRQAARASLLRQRRQDGTALDTAVLPDWLATG